MPPPRTMQSGSSTFITLASARAKRLTYLSKLLLASKSPARMLSMICSALRCSPVWRAWSSANAVPLIQVSWQPTCPHQQGVAWISSALGHGSGLCPHSPAIPLLPVQALPSIAIPPPQPVPIMTANTMEHPLADPSTASLTAKQLASFCRCT